MNKYSSKSYCAKCSKVGFPGGDNMYDMMTSYLQKFPNAGKGFYNMCGLCACLKARYLAVNDCRDKKIVVYVTDHGPVTMYFPGTVNAGAICVNLRRLGLFNCAFHVQDDTDGTFRVVQKRGDHKHLAVVYVPAQ